MKAVILAGGLGTRMGPETATRPKPLVEVGGRPILWHILKIYEAHGITEFIVCAGFAGHLLTEYFARERGESWRVQVVDTGEATATGGRLKRVRELVGSGTFCMTYGDGVADVKLNELLAFHHRERPLVTFTAVQPRLPFGLVSFADHGPRVAGFEEKPQLTDVWVNGGFFVMEPAALDYAECDDQAWEERPMTQIAAAGQLAGYKHHGFWQCMDTPRDRDYLERLWRDGAPWRIW